MAQTTASQQMGPAPGAGSAPATGAADPPLVFLLPGQGSQYPRMAAGLYGHFAEFSAAMDDVFQLLGHDGVAVRDDWLSAAPVVPIDHVSRSQILLFAVDYALGAQLRSWGVAPQAMLGHSVGEIAAAVLAGVFTLADGVALLWDRITRLAKAPPGRMLAVAAPMEQVAAFVSDEVVVGAVNAPRQVILSGPVAPMREVSERLRRAEIVYRQVPATTAFHSPMLAPYALGAEEVIRRVPVNSATIPLYSAYTGRPLTNDDLRNPNYWASHPVAPVWFWPTLQLLLAEGPRQLIEVGPGQRLATVARQHPDVRAGRGSVWTALPGQATGDVADRESVTRLFEGLATAPGGRR